MTERTKGARVEPGVDGSVHTTRFERLAWFALTVLGFSFWFMMAVPFASHRETYWWLAKVRTESFTYALSFISSTYRPLHQVTSWMAFQVLNPAVFPTSMERQAAFQLFVYGMFVVAWWLMFSSAVRHRMLALVAFAVGGVFFSGYVQLFHIYGTSYIPVMLMLGALLHLWALGTFTRHEVWLGATAIVLVLWHPFTTALFVAFYFGHYLDTFRQRSTRQHVQGIALLIGGTAAVATFVVGIPYLFPEARFLVETATRPIDRRLFAFLVTYQTNEVNRIASFVAFVLAQMVVFTMASTPQRKAIAAVIVAAAGAAFIWSGVPLIVLWLLAILAKLFTLQYWSLFFLALTAVLLPFGGGIGTPIHGLFAVIVAAYVTALAWPQGEKALTVVKTRYAAAMILALLTVILMIRAGIDLPVVKTVARPLLVERERTYQLENVLAWLHRSDYCAKSVEFAEMAGNPIESVESAISRQHRPPASREDVQLFWSTVLQCGDAKQRHDAGSAVITFGGPELVDLRRVFEVEGRFGGPATVWIRESSGNKP